MSGSFTLVFLAALAGGGSSDVTLVEFTDPRCQPCRAMEPVVQRLASEKYSVRQVDVTRQPQLARQYRIVAFPTFVLFAGDREVQRFAGMTTYDDLVQMIGRGQTPRAINPQSLKATAAGASGASAGVVRGQSPEGTQPVAQGNSSDQQALAATVRLRVEDEQGWGVGTGTIIDTHFDEKSQQYEALVLTCGHLFKSTGGKGKIEVELFAPGARPSVPGELLDYDEHLDVALVSIWPGLKVTPAPVTASGEVVRPHDVVFTAGCSEGKDPTIERSKIHAVNRYANRPNLTVGGRPAQGRSGGGLFNERGVLIGVCNSDDPQDGEGIYAGPAAIHAQLDKFNLQAIYQRETTLVAGSPPQATGENLASTAPIPAAAAADFEPVIAADEGAPRGSEPGSFAPPPGATATGAPTEVVCILRSRSDPQQTSEVLVIDGASAELIQRILDEAKATGQARLSARQRTAAVPVVRGQSER
ncbi:MAG TPA: trypsin-like peptidase domain-containing protein [Pirellulaceae bacterium]|nr:trypsin-like peptidase domain-containing protein [Pirellulaceae bacterium]